MTIHGDDFDSRDPVAYRTPYLHPRPRRFGPLAMLVPALLFLLAVLVLKDHAPDPGPRPAPPTGGGQEDVPGWSGAFEVRPGTAPAASSGTRLTARLTRLHPEPARQAFDARALRERLALGEGEPWLLTLRYDVPGERSGRDAPAAEAAGLPVSDVRIVDTLGAALVPLEASSAVADPLRTLLAPTRGRIFPGQTVNVFLWGREPVDGVEVLGIPSPDGASGAGDVTIALNAKVVGRTDDALAQLERNEQDDLATESER